MKNTKTTLFAILLAASQFCVAQSCPTITGSTLLTSTDCSTLPSFNFQKYGTNPGPAGDNFYYNCMYYAINGTKFNFQDRFPSPWEINKWNIKEFYSKKRDSRMEPDNLNAEGWELVKRHFGGPNGDGTNLYLSDVPYFILYNRYTGILRVFVLVTSEKLAAAGTASVPTGTQVFMIRLGFSGDPAINPQSAVLAMAEPVMEGVESFTRSSVIGVPNQYFSGEDYSWFRADFPMYYDPCTCRNTTDANAPTFSFNISAISEANVSLVTNIEGTISTMGFGMNGSSTSEVNNTNFNFDFMPTLNINNTINAQGTININTAGQTDKNEGGAGSTRNKICNYVHNPKVHKKGGPYQPNACPVQNPNNRQEVAGLDQIEQGLAFASSIAPQLAPIYAGVSWFNSFVGAKIGRAHV